jgi:putative Holliday junction resolvase
VRRPSRPETILALDFGARRIGVAVGSTLTGHGRPLAAIVVPPGRAADATEFARVASLAAEHGAARVVVGCPYNADGSDGAMTGRARAFAADLERRLQLPVHRVDERYSSIEAQQRLRARRASGQRRRRVAAVDVDSAAAVVILERWLGGEREAEQE